MPRKKALILVGLTIFLLVALFYFPGDKNEIKTEHFRFVFSSSIDSSKVLEISKSLEGSYLKVTRDLQTLPSKAIEVNIYADRWHYVKATHRWDASGSTEGPSKIHFIESSLEENKKTAIHEFTHTVVLELLINQDQQPFSSNNFDKKFESFPIWLWEAICVYEAQDLIDPRKLLDFRNGKYPSIKELNTRSKGQKIYLYGYTLIEFILSKYKHDKLVELIRNYGNLKKTFGVTDEQFSRDWYIFVKEKYLK